MLEKYDMHGTLTTYDPDFNNQEENFDENYSPNIEEDATEIIKLAEKFKQQLNLALESAKKVIKRKGVFWKINYLIKSYIEQLITLERNLNKNSDLTIEEEADITKILEYTRKITKDIMNLISQEDISIEQEYLKSNLTNPFIKEAEKQDHLTKSILEKIIKRAVCITSETNNES